MFCAMTKSMLSFSSPMQPDDAEPKPSVMKPVAVQTNSSTDAVNPKEECTCNEHKDGDCEAKGCRKGKEEKSDFEKFKEEFRKRVSGAIGATTTTPVESSGGSGISKKQEPLGEDSATKKPSSSEKRVDEESQEATAPVISKGAVVVPSVVEDEAAAAANKDADADPKPEEEAAAVEEGKNW